MYSFVNIFIDKPYMNYIISFNLYNIVKRDMLFIFDN